MKKQSTLLFIAIMLIPFLQSCSDPFSEVKNRSWEGQVYRIPDKKELADVRLKMTDDSLFIFSNAIFGAENDTLVLVGFNHDGDSIFNWESPSGEEFSCRLKYRMPGNKERLTFIGSDYFIVLKPSQMDVSEINALDFYKNKAVPRESYLYLDGVYEGTFESDNAITNIAYSQSGGLGMRFEFLDDHRIKIKVRSAYLDLFRQPGDPDYDIVAYRIIDKALYYKKNEDKEVKILIHDRGEILEMKVDDGRVLMYKED